VGAATRELRDLGFTHQAIANIYRNETTKFSTVIYRDRKTKQKSRQARWVTEVTEVVAAYPECRAEGRKMWTMDIPASVVVPVQPDLFPDHRRRSA